MVLPESAKLIATSSLANLRPVLFTHSTGCEPAPEECEVSIFSRAHATIITAPSDSVSAPACSAMVSPSPVLAVGTHWYMSCAVRGNHEYFATRSGLLPNPPEASTTALAAIRSVFPSESSATTPVTTPSSITSRLAGVA